MKRTRNICMYLIQNMATPNTTEDELMKFICKALQIEPHELKDGLIIERDTLICKEKYEKLKPCINDLKKIFSSKCMTSMHSSAEHNQRMGYDILPERRCAGRDQDGKKMFERFFKLHKRENMVKINEEINDDHMS
jgi:hypothetical protein